MTVLRVDTIAASGQTSENTGSVYFDGSGDYLSVGVGTDFDFGVGDFTVEWFQYWNTTPSGYQTLLSINYGTNPNFTIQTDNAQAQYIVYMNGVSANITESSSTSTQQWNHYAVVRSGSTVTIYRNGNSTGSTTYAGVVGNSFQPLLIGGKHPSDLYFFDGYISNLRIVKGKALYTSNFTVPTKELEVVDGTVLLCCQSAINTTEEKTGKIIAAYGDKTSAGIGTTTTDSPSPIGVSTVNPGLTKKVDAVLGPVLQGDLKFNSQNFIVLPKGTSSQVGVLRDTQDVVGPDRAWYDNLVLAMPFNEATGLRDVSSRNRNPGNYGNVSISSTISKYYGSSAKFDGTGDYLSIAGIGTTSTSNASDFQFGTGDWTIEFWWNGSAAGSFTQVVGTLVSSNEAGTWRVGTRFNSLNRIYFANGTGSDFNDVTFDVNVNDGSWYHIAFVKSSGVIIPFVNGVDRTGDQVGGNTTSTGNLSTTNPVKIGYNSRDNAYITGYLQDLRIYKGIAKYTANFTPPERIAETGVGFKTGALRYNTDSNKPELYDGNQWTELQLSSPALGRGADTGPGARGIFAGGDVGTPYTPSGQSNVIDYVNISSTGNAVDFGDLTARRAFAGANSSSTRALIGGGYEAPASNSNIDFITISSTGDATNFGNLQTAQHSRGCLSNATRGLWGGGTVNNEIDYVTIASEGSAQDFGNLIAYRDISGLSSPTRGIFAGGFNPAFTNVINFVTISTLGSTESFGELTRPTYGVGAASNSTRGIFAGGRDSPTGNGVNTIEYITIATTGNSVNFGDLTDSAYRLAATSSPTRAVIYLSTGSPVAFQVDYITFATQGNSVDFGSLNDTDGSGRRDQSCDSGTSNAHGGL